MNIATARISDLWPDAIDQKARYFDYYKRIDWEVIHGFGENDDYYDYEQPMMNYFYPLPNFKNIVSDPEIAAKKLARTVSLCLIYLTAEDEYGMALTGGGMDLSWDICEAYVRLGYLPPVEFCRLPEFAGMRLTPTKKKIITACRRSLKIMERRINLTKYHLRQLTCRLKTV